MDICRSSFSPPAPRQARSLHPHVRSYPPRHTPITCTAVHTKRPHLARPAETLKPTVHLIEGGGDASRTAHLDRVSRFLLFFWHVVSPWPRYLHVRTHNNKHKSTCRTEPLNHLCICLPLLNQQPPVSFNAGDLRPCFPGASAFMASVWPCAYKSYNGLR